MIQHHGIIITDREASEYEAPPLREWPTGVISHGDSFLVWGEHRRGDDGSDTDGTLHLIYEGPLSFGEVRYMIAKFLYSHERLVDYAMLSDKDDWSKDEEVFGLEQFERRYSQ